MTASFHLLTLADPEWTSGRIATLLGRATEIKTDPRAYARALGGKTLVMLFEKPSLRTRISFEVGMSQLGGHAIFYSIADSPLGKKETFGDTGQVLSRFADLVMARLFAHSDCENLAAASSIPIINGLTDFSHPCQILSDLLTIVEKKGRLAGVKLAYLGDANNNVTHSLLYGCARMGLTMSVGCPRGETYEPQPAALARARELADDPGALSVTHDAAEAVAGADIVYTDSWMSYHIADDEKAARIAALTRYQVTAERMAGAATDALFMNCLPAMRGQEQTAEVIDGPQSIVFDQAENRLHLQKALMVELHERATAD